MLDQKEIMERIPHRYPMLLVDRILEMEEGKRAVGLKAVSGNEPFFQGHYPGNPIMPGVLILEAMAQTGAVAILGAPEARGKIPLFAGMDKVRFRRPVLPGDLLRLEMEITRRRGSIGQGVGKAWVGDQLVAEAEFMFAIADKVQAES